MRARSFSLSMAVIRPVRTIISPNCSGVCKRPSVSICQFSCVPLDNGHGAEAPRRELGVLLLDGRRHFLDADAVFGQLVRIEPDAHGIVLRPETVQSPTPLCVVQLINEIDLHPVGNIDLVVTAIWRIAAENLEHGRGALGNGYALAAHFFRQLGLGQVDLVVDVDHAPCPDRCPAKNRR